MRKTSPKGVTLIEVLIGMFILALVGVAVGKAMMQMSQQTQHIKDRAFASQKAIQMMEELRGLVPSTTDKSIGVLDNYNDGTSFNPVLTTKNVNNDPSDPLSGNAGLKYSRQVVVAQIPNQPLARRVYVYVYDTAHNVLAQTVSVLYSIQNQYPPTQSYDVYVLAIENVPGWWSALNSMRPTFDNVLQDLQTRNPGLEMQTHWITQLAFGRDPYYTPSINSATTLDVTPPPWIYFYPGNLSTGGGNTAYYYDPDFFNGRVNVDGQFKGSYTLADEFNHAVRYPDEVTLYNQAVAAAAAQTPPQPPPEITYRMLLEQMNSTASPNPLKNLLLINLHGELLPMPPMRNYSDAAKEPSGSPNVRLVTHPQQMYYPTGSSVILRVYSYVSGNFSVFTDTSVISSATIYIPGANIPSASIKVEKMVGNSSTRYQWQLTTSATDYTVTNPGGATLITLYKSPLRHMQFTSGAGHNNSGLDPGAWLSGMEYIPCEVTASTFNSAGAEDLSFTDDGPKNTARWRITLQSGAGSNGQYAFETRLGTDLTTGSSTNQPSNLSRTYVWLGSASVPITEQFQFIGDPRHMPYSDVKKANGYNWWFTDNNGSMASYGGFTKVSNTTNGWDGGTLATGTGALGNVCFDVPRFYQILRGGLLNAGGLWTTMTGWSFFYMGLGGELGDDGHVNPGWTNGLPILATPWTPSNTTTVLGVNEMINNGSGWQNSANTLNPRLIAKSNGSWAGIPWLGELYPDSDFAIWRSTGNLPTGTSNPYGAGTGYYRAQYIDANAAVAAVTNGVFSAANNPTKRTAQSGVASFFNGTPSGSGINAFNHESGSEDGNLTATGITIMQDFNFPLVTTLSSVSQRPFTTNGGYTSDEWSDSTYSNQRTKTNLIESYYSYNGDSNYNMSSMVSVTSGTQVANFIVNGVANQANFGTAEIGKLIMIDMFRGFMQAGNPSLAVGKVTQVPLVTISTPVVGAQFPGTVSNITVYWNIAWTRWDGSKYTGSYPTNFTDSTPLTTNLKYSVDAGKTWLFVQDGTPATLGAPDVAHNISATSYAWNIAPFTMGNVFFRVEVFRQNYPLHYTYHQRQFYVLR